MGYTTSTVHGIQVPDSSQANNIPNDLGLVVTALESGSLVKRLTAAQISALTAPQKPAGLVVYNTTTNKLQISDGSGFADYVAGTPVHAIGVKTGSTSLASHSSAPSPRTCSRTARARSTSTLAGWRLRPATTTTPATTIGRREVTSTERPPRAGSRSNRTPSAAGPNALVWRATDGTPSDSNSFTITVTSTFNPDTTAPTVPTGCSGVGGSGTVTITCDQASDPFVTATGAGSGVETA
jgi:hypothetical protein